MAAKRFTFDTNILFYAIDARDSRKHSRARRLLNNADSTRVPLLLQTLGELSNAVIRRQPLLLSQTEKLVQVLSVMFAVVPADFADISEALSVHNHHHLQFWDAVLWATARRSGCSIFLSEDMQDGRTLDGVTFRNPFIMPVAEFDSYLS